MTQMTLKRVEVLVALGVFGEWILKGKTQLATPLLTVVANSMYDPKIRDQALGHLH